MNKREKELALKKKCIKSASGCASAEEWFIKDFACFEEARRKGILDDILDLVIQDFTRPVWTLAMCKHAASQFYTWKSWEKYHIPTFTYARRNNWLEKCSEEISTDLVNSCISKLDEYGTGDAWIKGDVSSYLVAFRENLTKNHPEISKFFGSGFEWTEELCVVIASQFKNKTEWYSCHQPSYQAARSNWWLDKLMADKQIKRKAAKSQWTKSKCIEEAFKYTSKDDWKEGSPASFKQARKCNWMTVCTEHMVIKKKPKPDELIEDAKKYKTVQCWRKNSASKFNMARSLGLISECTKHMDVPSITPMGRKVIDYINKSFASVSEWKESDPSSYQYVVERDLMSSIKVPD